MGKTLKLLREVAIIRKTLQKKSALTIVLSLLLLVGISLATTGVVHATEVDYAGNNSNISGDDVVGGPLPIGFNFTYYGNPYTTGYASTNGNFSLVGTNQFWYTNDTLSNSDSNEFGYYDVGPWLNTIYPFWDDLITQDAVTPPYDAHPTLYYTTIGTAPHRRFIMQWTNMYFYAQPDLPMGTFQMILDEGTNVIHFQYRDLLGGSASLGDSATIGIKGNDDTQFNEYSFNNASLAQGQAITFTPNGDSSYDIDSNADYLPVYVLPLGVPASPSVINPADGLTGAINTPTFEWGAADLATSYNLLVSTHADFSDTIVNQTGLTDTTFTLDSPLDFDTTYYWKVAAVNTAGSTFSETRSFTTAAESFPAPNTPSQISSATLFGNHRINASSLNHAFVKMRLTDSDHAQQLRYRLQISPNSDFSNPTIDYRSTYSAENSTKTFNFGTSAGTYLAGSGATTLDDGQAYYVRLSAEDQHAQSSDWTGPSGVAFTYDTTPPVKLSAPTLVGPASPTSTKLTWAASSDSHPANPFYKLQYSSDSAFSTFTSVSTNSTSVTITNLNEGKYYARVLAVDSAGNSSTPSPVRGFIVATAGTPYNPTIALLADTSSDTGSSQTPGPASPTITKAQDDAVSHLVVHIVDENNNPLKGVLVTLHSKVQTAYTDELGNAAFNDVPSGFHHVSADYNNMHSEKTINLIAKPNEGSSQKANVNLELSQAATITKPGGFKAIYLLAIIPAIAILILVKPRKTREKP